MNSTLAALLKRPDLWQASATLDITHGIATGYAPLNASLHHGGWPTGALTELLCRQPGSGELQLLAPTLAQLSAAGHSLVLIAPPYLPYAPAWQHWNISLERLLVVQTTTLRDQLWATEQGLRAASGGAVLTWLTTANLSVPQLRKLQLAAQAGAGLAILFRSRQTANQPSPATLRIAIESTADGCQLTILKQRGGWSGQSVCLQRPDILSQRAMPTQRLPAPQPVCATGSETDPVSPPQARPRALPLRPALQ